MHTIRNRYATGVVIDGTVHVLKRSSSRYHLAANGERGQYVCQDGCCDRGLQPDVQAVVEAAAALGAKRVVLRTGQRGYYHREIAGLPVTDVSECVGDAGEGAEVYAAW